MDIDVREQLAHIEEKIISNTKRIDTLEEKEERTEQIVKELDKSLSISMKQIETIAENLKQTSINFKEAVMRSNAVNAKDTEVLKEKYKELDAKIEKVNEKLEKETIGKDAESWRASKKQIWSWALNIILALIAVALGISKFM
ncbi:MAG: hypothetical protein ACI4U9_01610 [Clostridia bacterium]